MCRIPLTTSQKNTFIKVINYHLYIYIIYFCVKPHSNDTSIKFHVFSRQSIVFSITYFLFHIFLCFFLEKEKLYVISSLLQPFAVIIIFVQQDIPLLHLSMGIYNLVVASSIRGTCEVDAE